MGRSKYLIEKDCWYVGLSDGLKDASWTFVGLRFGCTFVFEAQWENKVPAARNRESVTKKNNFLELLSWDS